MTLKDVLAFCLETGMPLKFDNVVNRFPAPMREAFCRAVIDTGFIGDKQSLIGITGTNLEYLSEMHARLPLAHIHYDGLLPEGDEGEAVLDALHALVPPEQLTVWLPLYRISWCPVAPADEGRIAAIHRVGTCGLWIVNDRGQIPRALELDADWIETDGVMVPEDLL